MVRHPLPPAFRDSNYASSLDSNRPTSRYRSALQRQCRLVFHLLQGEPAINLTLTVDGSTICRTNYSGTPQESLMTWSTKERSLRHEIQYPPAQCRVIHRRVQ